MNDSLGYDIELHDTQEHFVRGTKSTTKKCYFDVKGTSGSFHEEKTSFHISQNEREKCQSIAFDSRKQQREAYLLVIIEYCLDPETIALAKVTDWSSNFKSVELRVDSNQCRFLSTSSARTTQDNNEDINTDADHWRYEEQEHSNRSYNDNRNQYHRQATNFEYEHSRNCRGNPRPYDDQHQRHEQRWRQPSQQQQQQEQTHEFYGRGRGRDRVNYPNAQDSNWRRR